jgi:hypothetical protein
MSNYPPKLPGLACMPVCVSMTHCFVFPILITLRGLYSLSLILLELPQALLDGLTAAFYNAFFTALPAGLFACFDRPVRYLSTLMTYPQVYNRRPPLTGREFWKTAVLLGIIHGAVSQGTDQRQSLVVHMYMHSKTVLPLLLQCLFMVCKVPGAPPLSLASSAERLLIALVRGNHRLSLFLQFRMASSSCHPDF